MVGSILHDQETKDREQYVFLTQDYAGMETVQEQLADLTDHMHRLSMGEEGQKMEGPASDGPKRVEVELVMASSSSPVFLTHFHTFLGRWHRCLEVYLCRKWPNSLMNFGARP